MSDEIDRDSAAHRLAEASQLLGRWWARDFRPGQSLVWLSETQYGILTVVAQEPDLNISRIADRLGVSPPTVTRAVGTLEGKGLVSRVRRSSHARDITVKLTPTGEETRSVLEERRHRQIVALLAQMDDEGVQRVVDAYETMVNAVQTLSRRDGPGD